ncbi:hypothetical protein [uncultured Erythrobacter sp.]|uniref:hypothetical protein n=1 Tax=uncultured Erythrobacter sp. TaxID=263913 RepID=UPI00260CDE7F|nr:hypothetical protein [uncultured Erythrobacter sp.]
MIRNLLGATLLMAMAAIPANAATRACVGYVDFVYVRDDGSAYVDTTWSQSSHQVCNVKADWKGITPDLCLSWMAQLGVAIAYGKNTRIDYRDIPSCGTLPSYNSAPAPLFIMVRHEDRP